jgi:integrase
VSEAAGLLQEDIVMKDDMMTVCIRPNKLRDLKTRSSERQIPLVGLARHAVEVLLCNNSTSLFPTMLDNKLNGNSLSAAACLQNEISSQSFPRRKVLSLDVYYIAGLIMHHDQVQ